MPRLDSEGFFTAMPQNPDLVIPDGDATPFIRLDFEITEPPEHKGKHIDWRGYLSDGARKITIRQLTDCGWDGMDLDDVKVKGPVRIKAAREPNQKGQVFLRVAGIYPMTEKKGFTNTTAPDAKRAFAQKMRGKVAATRAELNADNPTSNGSKKTEAKEFDFGV